MKSLASPVSAAQVKAVRGFNRFYTQRIGVLMPYLGSELTLTEVRVLYELAHRQQPTASELARDLLLDAGYLSRILRRFEGQGWLARSPSPADARQSLLQLSEAGHQAFAPLQQRSRDEAAALLAPLPEADRKRVIESMKVVHRLLDAADAPTPAPVLRDPRPGDMGWVVMQHGEIYGQEDGFNWEFEALVAEIAAGFIKNFRPAREKGWIAEMRLLILTAAARGQGLGGRLVDECIAFARARHYRKLVLWTNAHLQAARAIYQSRGFVMTASEPFQGYGRNNLIGETWELKL
jgi:DNA-binding MarR family transcriptional regulator/GNAT superfamily N-acetyltransferase